MSDTKQAEWPQKMARGFEFRTNEEEELYYLCSENKAADHQLHDHSAADLLLYFLNCNNIRVYFLVHSTISILSKSAISSL